MNLKEFLSVVASDLMEAAKSGVADVGYATMLDAMIASYRKLCISISKKYLSNEGNDAQLLKEFRRKFLTMTKLSVISIDEIDAYLTCVYTNKCGKVMKICMTAEQVRREIKQGRK